jgi:2'-5' RNA ligase
MNFGGEVLLCKTSPPKFIPKFSNAFIRVIYTSENTAVLVKRQRVKPMIKHNTTSHPRFFIALMLPDEVEAYANQVIRELSDRYNTRTAKAAPHITLQPPFTWPLGSVDMLEGAIATVAASQPAIPVHLSGFGCFSPRVLYINVVKTPELISAQQALMNHLEDDLNIVDPKANGRAFAPHVTVASRRITPGVFKQAWRELRDREVTFKFVCDRLTLLLYENEGTTQRWIPYRTCPLCF